MFASAADAAMLRRVSGSCLVIAHRGAWGIAVPNSPAENTLEAFEAAIALGVDMIELDVRRTSDGQLVVFHDARVKTVPTSSLPYDALKTKHGKSRPPLLQEVLELTKDRIALNLEIPATSRTRLRCCVRSASTAVWSARS
jgi:glycerophosphoryl diester phosphodiesterase